MTCPTPPSIPGYTFERDLGRGGFSDVYLYSQHTPRRHVAIKVLRIDTLDARERQAFTHEADTMAQLEGHPNIVPVLAADLTSDGRPYLVMTFYPNDDLGKQVSARPLGLAEGLRTGIQIACAVESAHRLGVLHRDIKPANILVSRAGAPGLTDFGIASALAGQEDEEVGVSVPWSAPELLSGSSNGSVATDVYSLGATIWHLLVGRSPFSAPGGDNSQSAMVSRILRSPPPVTSVSGAPAVDRLLVQCMAKDPTRRPATAAQVARELQQIEVQQSFSRTPLVVLDPEVDEVASGLGTLRVNEAGGADRTIGKTPTVVTPQSMPDPENPTLAKGPALRSTIHGPEASVTLHKPAASLTGPDEPSPQTTAARSSRWPWWAAAGAAVIIAAAVAVHLLTPAGSQHGHVTTTGHTVVQSPDALAPSAPTSPVLRCTVTAGSAHISWRQVPGAVGYAWQLASGSSSSQKEVDTTSLDLPLPPRGKLRVQVLALNQSGVASELSQPSRCKT